MAQVERITTGFLTGNLLNETDGLDVDATINSYTKALQASISAAYPGAEVEVLHQDAEGSLPHGLRTHVYYSDGKWAVEDGGLSSNDDVEVIDHIAKHVFELGGWYVES